MVHLCRGKYNIKRGIDGRVQLRRKSNGNWMSVRLDMEVPGAILLRDMKTEAIFALETDGLPQVCIAGAAACTAGLVVQLRCKKEGGRHAADNKPRYYA